MLGQHTEEKFEATTELLRPIYIPTAWTSATGKLDSDREVA